MSGKLGDYLELVAEAQKKRIQITRKQQRQIAELFRQSAKYFQRAASRKSEKSLTYRWLEDYATSLRLEAKSIFAAIGSLAEKSIKDTSAAVIGVERRFYTKACPALSERFRDVFSSIPQDMVEELINGRIYVDFKGLSVKLWDYERKYTWDIAYIINRGIVQQKPAYDLAKDLELYLLPNARKPWNWSVVYPGTNRVVDYSAQRLARTAVTHAYQLSFQRATQDNPFVEAYRWHSSNGSRTCDICRARDGQLFPKDQLPLDHPNGMCAVTAEISKSYTEISQELSDWATGENQDPSLDRWLNSGFDNGRIALTGDEEYALTDYISSGSYKLNYPLRHGLPLTDEQVKLSRDLDSALEKIPIYRGMVYRSIDNTEIDDINAFIANYTVGSYHNSSAYLSASTQVYDESMPIQYVIQSETGRDIRPYNPNESEILFPRNCSFFVTKVEGTTIYLQEA